MGDNGLMMRCAKCGEMNRLPMVHCKKCGAKLDFEAAEHQILKTDGRSFRIRVGNQVRLVVAGILALILLLLVWPGRMARTVGDEMDAKRYRLKCEFLIDALNRGAPTSRVIEEKEINAHLREMLAAQPVPGGGFSASLEDMGVRFSAGRTEAFVAIRRGPLTFTGNFYAEPQGAELVVTGAKAGHLPLPGILGQLYAKTQAGLFRQMKKESRIAQNLGGAAVNDGSIELLTPSGN